jgi:hypothetical protein
VCVYYAVRYIGFLTRCALSKPRPELSIINSVNAMALATGRIPNELSAEVFGDGAQADQLAYAGVPTTRPCELRSMPFLPVCRVRMTAAHWDRVQQLNSALRRDLRNEQLRAQFVSILRRDNARWRFNRCDVAVCLYGVVRDKVYEKPWDYRQDGYLVPTADWSTNQHVFACPCNTDTRVSVEAIRDPLPLRLDTGVPPAAIDCSQRAPFQDDEVIAYGLVKRWIVVHQQLNKDQRLSAVIAHVRIFVWTPEMVTGCPLLRQYSLAPYDDHYMLAKHIVCRITLCPRPNDEAHYLVSHVL